MSMPDGNPAPSLDRMLQEAAGPANDLRTCREAYVIVQARMEEYKRLEGVALDQANALVARVQALKADLLRQDALLVECYITESKLRSALVRTSAAAERRGSWYQEAKAQLERAMVVVEKAMAWEEINAEDLVTAAEERSHEARWDAALDELAVMVADFRSGIHPHLVVLDNDSFAEKET